MGTTAQKLQNIIDSKAAISAAIEAKGGTVPQELSGYGPAIEALPSGGGSSDLAAKIVDRSVTAVTAADLSGATSIGDYAFYTCGQLTSVSIPDTVTTIRTGAFSSCGQLSSITFSNGITEIAPASFQSDSSCIIFDFSRATVIPTLKSTTAFNSTNANKKIIVPDALYNSWKAKSNWKSTTNGIVDAITKASEA